jgi:hypothetical protein
MELREVNSLEIIEILNNQAVFYMFTRADIFSQLVTITNLYFIFVFDRYLSENF